jgi:hypothetical protein
MIDTLKFARRMTDAGMDAKVAERLAEEFDDALKQSDVATGTQLQATELTLKTEVRTSETNLKADLRTSEASLKSAIAEFKGDLKAEIAKSRSQVIVAVAVLVFLGQIAPAVVTWIRAAAHP